MEALSLAANIISVVHVTSEIIERLNDFRNTIDGLPRALQAISNELPTLRLTLKKVSEAIEDGRVTEDSQEALKPLIADFEFQIRSIAEIVEKMKPRDPSRMTRNLKAVTSFRYDGRIKYHEGVIRGYASTLSLERVVSGPGKDLAALQPPLIPTFVCPYGQDPDFIERPLLVDILAQRRPGSRHALVGGAGMGKSQLAISYGYNIQEALPDTWVFWIDAETTTKFEQGYQEIAKTVRVKGRNEKGADILNLVYEWLRDKSNGNWVMILDNADDKDVFTSCPSSHRQASSGKHIGDFLPQSSNGSILVTSRSRDAAFQVTCNYKYIFTVEPMTESEAMELLQSQLEGKHPEPEMKLLAEALGFVPLAISQAAANISRRSLPISNYLEELRKGNESSASLLDESSPQLRRDSGRTNSIVATWKVTFEYVRRTTPSAARLLSLMCFFDRQNIPEALLEGQYGEEVNIKWQQYRKTWWKRKLGVKRKKAGLLPVKILPCDFETDWLTLRDFSLIKMDQNRGNFSMHPMVQFTTLKWLVLHRERDVWSQHFTSLMNDKFPTPGYSVSRECDRLIAHAFAAIPYRPADTATRSLQTWAELTLKVADYYKDFRTAIDFAQKLYRIVAEAFDIVFGKIAPASLALHSKRGTVLMFLDRNVEAEKLHRRTLHLQSHALGPTHPDTLTTMDHVGETLAAQGRDSEAEELLVGALNTRLRIFGPRHEITQNALYARGMYLRQRSRYGEAHDVWRRAHEARVQRDANVYDLTWAVQLTSLGIWPQMSGNAKEAERYFREALSERAKGPIDADYAMCLAQIARTLVAQGDLEGAEPLFRRACEWYDKQASSKSDQDKFYISMELAMVLSKSDDCLDEAEQHTRQCLNALLEHDEAKPDDVCAARRILGNVLEKRGRCEGALDQYRQAYDGAKRFLGEQHGDTQEYRRLYDELLEKSSSASSATVPGETAETLRDGHASSLDGLVHGTWQSEHHDDDTTAGAEMDNTARQHKGTKLC